MMSLVMEKMYNHEITRLNKSLLFTEDEESLFSLKADHLHRVSNNKVIQLFCNELRAMLSMETPLELFKRVESLGFYLESLKEEDPDKVPSLDEFFKVLSPFMMRAIIENIESDEGEKPYIKAFRKLYELLLKKKFIFGKKKSFKFHKKFVFKKIFKKLLSFKVKWATILLQAY